MPRRTYNLSGPRNYTAPAHEFGVRTNHTVRQLRVRRDAAGLSTGPQAYLPTNLSGPLNDAYPVHDGRLPDNTVLSQIRVRRDASGSNGTSTNNSALAITNNSTSGSGGFSVSGEIADGGIFLAGVLTFSVSCAAINHCLRRREVGVGTREPAVTPLLSFVAIPFSEESVPPEEPLSSGVPFLFDVPPAYHTLSNIPAATVSASDANLFLDEEDNQLPLYDSICPPSSSNASLEDSESASMESLPPSYSSNASLEDSESGSMESIPPSYSFLYD